MGKCSEDIYPSVLVNLGKIYDRWPFLVVMDKTYFLQMVICKNYWQYLPHQEALSWLTLAKGGTRKAGKRKAAKGAANACSLAIIMMLILHKINNFHLTSS